MQPDSQNLSSDDPTNLAGDATFSGNPESYSIEIASQEANYTINVEDCGASAAPAQGANQQTSLPQTGQSNTSSLWKPVVPPRVQCPSCPVAVAPRSTRSREAAPVTGSS